MELILNRKYICKDTIKQRKIVYGNNFPEIAKLESEYLGIKILPSEAAYKLALLKKVRIEFIKNKLRLIKNNEDFNDSVVIDRIKMLNIGLEDSIKDMNNYLWISLNYDEYEKM